MKEQKLYPGGQMNGAVLKWIAIISMLIDHFASSFLLAYNVTSAQDFQGMYANMRLVGRLAFPIFAFLIVQGYQHTSDIKKYIRNLFLFALISEVPFDLAFYRQPMHWGHQNIFFTLFLGVIALALYEKFEQIFKQGLAVLLFGLLAEILAVDYGLYGVFFIVGLGILRDKKLIQALFIIVMGSVQMTASLAVIPLWFYNGERGRQNKWFFYIFYPGHLALIYFLRLYVIG